jgi:hypothetical protein
VLSYVGIGFSERKLRSSFPSILGNLFRAVAFMVRTWVVWNRNRYVGGGLAILWIGIGVNSGVLVVLFSRSVIRMCLLYLIVPHSITIFAAFDKPYDGFQGCFDTVDPKLFEKYEIPVFIQLCCLEAGEYA